MKLLTIVFMFSFLCGCTPKVKEDSCNFQLSEGQRVSWGSNVPVVMFIDTSVPIEHTEAIYNAAKTWNTATKKELIRVEGRMKLNPKSKDGVNGIYFSTIWNPDRSEQEAFATVSFSGDRIFDGDILINGQDYNYLNEIDLESLVLHEMGHVLGLTHNETPESVMRASLSANFLRRNVNNVDINSLSCEY